MVEVIKNLGLASIFLLVGYALRSNIKIFQKLFIPASVIGGLFGLLVGPEVLGKIAPFSITFVGDGVGSWAMPMLAIVFTSMFLGSKITKDTLAHSGATFFLNCGTMSLQLALGLTLVHLFKNEKLWYGFGMFPYLGFYGGHGVPANTAAVFGAAGVFDADIGTSAGNTFATVGLLLGIIGGIVIINIGVRKGFVSSKASLRNLSDEDFSGFLKKENRFAAVTALTKKDVINPVALHVGIIGMVMCLGYWLLPFIQKIPYCGSLNITIPVLLVSVAVNIFCGKTGLDKYLDHASLSSLTGAVLEYIIVTSVANTKLSVFVDFGLEIVVLSVVILVATIAYVFYFGKKWHKDHWCENALGTFGLASGVLATGFLLIRVADPDDETGAAVNLSCGNGVSTSTIQVFNNYVFPVIVVSSVGFSIGYPVVSFFIYTILGIILFQRKKTK